MHPDSKPQILVVDDSRSCVEDFMEMLKDSAECSGAYSSDEALAIINSNYFDLILLDHDLGHGITGLDILNYIIERNLNTPVIMISKHADYQMVRKAWFAGAADFLGKTPDRSELKASVDRCLAKGVAQRTNKALKRDIDSLFGAEETWLLTGISSAIESINREILKIAPTDIRVLITGESGTGKERIARAIHIHSGRSDGPFVAINCAGMPASLADSELFGHVKGAFSGAVNHRQSKFEEADGGTLFLDEIGDMEISLQMKLLRVLEQKEFHRLGSNATIKTDIRLVCATNADIEKAVRDGNIRTDLFQRIRVATIHVPPLRSRLEDVPPLAEKFLRNLRIRLKRPQLSLSREALRVLQQYDWPGNIRELEYTLENAAVHCLNDQIDAHDVQARCGVKTVNFSYTDAKEAVLKQFQLEYWTSLWKLCQGNKSEMARVSEVSRQGIDKILKNYGIEKVEMPDKS